MTDYAERQEHDLIADLTKQADDIDKLAQGLRENAEQWQDVANGMRDIITAKKAKLEHQQASLIDWAFNLVSQHHAAKTLTPTSTPASTHPTPPSIPV